MDQGILSNQEELHVFFLKNSHHQAEGMADEVLAPLQE